MFVREDQDVRRPETPGGTYRTVLADYSRHTLTGEAGYDLPRDSRLTMAYTFERMSRDFREVAWMNDHRLKVQFDTRRFGLLELKSWYQRTSRSAADYRFNQYNEAQGNPLARPMLPYLRKFDEADYRRNEAQVMVTAYVTDSTSLSAHAQYLSTDYLDSPAGLLWDKRYSYGADFTYALTDRRELLRRWRSRAGAIGAGCPSMERHRRLQPLPARDRARIQQQLDRQPVRRLLVGRTRSRCGCRPTTAAR